MAPWAPWAGPWFHVMPRGASPSSLPAGRHGATARGAATAAARRQARQLTRLATCCSFSARKVLTKKTTLGAHTVWADAGPGWGHCSRAASRGLPLPLCAYLGGLSWKASTQTSGRAADGQTGLRSEKGLRPSDALRPAAGRCRTPAVLERAPASLRWVAPSAPNRNTKTKKKKKTGKFPSFFGPSPSPCLPRPCFQ